MGGKDEAKKKRASFWAARFKVYLFHRARSQLKHPRHSAGGAAASPDLLPLPLTRLPAPDPSPLSSPRAAAPGHDQAWRLQWRPSERIQWQLSQRCPTRKALRSPKRPLPVDLGWPRAHRPEAEQRTATADRSSGPSKERSRSCVADPSAACRSLVRDSSRRTLASSTLHGSRWLLPTRR